MIEYWCLDCLQVTELVSDGYLSMTDRRQDTPTNYVCDCCSGQNYEEYTYQDKPYYESENE